jgi:hypothetical protein
VEKLKKEFMSAENAMIYIVIIVLVGAVILLVKIACKKK